MTLRAWAFVAALALAVGCKLDEAPRTDVADGGACDGDSECSSGECVGGYCAGRGCTLDDASSCDPGWRCTHFEGVLLRAPRNECVPLCGSCPPNRHCALGGKDGETTCVLGAPRKVTITGPDRVVVQKEATFSVTVEPPFERVQYVEWRVGETPGEGQSFGPESMTTTAKLELNREGDFFVTAIVHGEATEEPFATAEGVLAVRHECLGAGEVCDADGDGYDHPQLCCTTGLHCAGKSDARAPRVCESRQ